MTRLEAIKNGEENAELLKNITNVLGNAKVNNNGVQFKTYKKKVNDLLTITLNLSQEIADYYMNKAIKNLKTWVCPVTGKTATI